MPIISQLLSAQLILMAKSHRVMRRCHPPSAGRTASCGRSSAMKPYMLHKRQLEGVTTGDVLGQHRVIN
jgi:hypothetical protein